MDRLAPIWIGCETRFAEPDSAAPAHSRAGDVRMHRDVRSVFGRCLAVAVLTAAAPVSAQRPDRPATACRSASACSEPAVVTLAFRDRSRASARTRRRLPGSSIRRGFGLRLGGGCNREQRDRRRSAHPMPHAYRHRFCPHPSPPSAPEGHHSNRRGYVKHPRPHKTANAS